MQTFVDASSYDSPDPQRLPAGFGRGLVASFEETAISGPVFGGYLLNEVRKAGETGRLLSQEEAKAYIAAEGFADIDVPETGLTDAQAEMLVTLRRDRQEGEDVISRASGVANFVGSVGGGFADPAMGLLNFVPIVGASREAAIIARASARSGALGRLGARAAVGAVEGAVGGVMSAPLTGLVKEGLGDDYTMEDALAEIGTSAVFGGAIQGGTGALADAAAKLADRSSRGWIKKHFGTESLEWRKIEEQDKALREALVPEKTAEIDAEVVRAADDAEAVVRLEEPAATPERVSQAVRDALGDRPVLRAADEGADPFSVSVARAIQDSQATVIADPAGIMPLVKVFDAIAKDRQKGLSVAESIESGALSKMGPTQVEAARVAMEIHDQPERMQRFVSSFVEARKNWNSKIALEEAIAKVSTLDGPAEKFRAAPEATRQNAEAVASFQEEAGTRINPERVIDAEVRAEGGGAPEVAKEIQKAGNPSYRHDAADLKDASEKARKAEAEPVRDDYDTMADEQEEVLRKLLEESGVEAKFAEGKELPDGATESDLRIQDAAAAIEARFGAGTIETARKAGFEIVAAKDLPEQAQRANVVGVTVGKKSYLAADRMNRQDAAAYFLHEYGVHVGMEGMLGAKGFADIQAKVGDLLARDPDLQAVVASLVPTTTKSIHVAEERLAYLVQHMEGVLSGREDWPKGAAWLRVADPETRRAIVELVREIVAKVKAYLYSEFPALRGMELSAEDIHAIAVRSLQHGAEMDRRARFAESGGAPEMDEIKAAKDLSKRVRDVYRKAYDKVASVSDQMDREQLTAAAMSAGLDEAEARGLVDRFRNFQGDAKAAADAHESEVALNRYRATLNAIRLHEGMRIVLGFKGREAEGALALDGGSEHNRFGARVSADYWRRSWKDTLQNGAAQELHKAGLWKLARRKEFARNIINALYDVQTNSTENLGRTYTKDHLAVAKVMEKYQRLGLMEMKRHGVDIGQLEGRMLHQDHDSWALRNFANNGRTGATRSAIRGLLPSKKRVNIGDPAHREAWIDFVLPLLEEKTYDGRVVDREYLAGAYNLLAGFKEPSQDADLLGGRYGPGGVKGEAERRSGMARNMKFKGPDEWAAYQQRCGNPDFMSNFMGELDGMARSIGIMRIYGPGGEFTRQMMHQSVGHQLSGVSALKWQNSRKDRETSLAVLNGSVNIPASEVIANVATNTRNIFKASILGGSILSQTGDFVNVGKARALRFNRGIGGVYGEALSHVRDFMRTIKPGPAQKAVIEAFGADIDATIGGLLREVENGDSRGFTSRLVEKVYQYQGATWLNRHNRQAAALGMSNWLGSESRRGWNEIEPTTREFLQEHRFTEADWELIRRGEMIADDGRSYLTPESVATLSDEAIADHLRATGSQATERHVAAWRVDTANHISAMMTDYVSQALTEPSIRSRMVTTGGTQAGTWSGELVRSMWDVKSFMVSQIQKGIQTERFGRSSDPRARVKAGSASQYLAIANYMAAMTMAGYASYVLKGWASGVSRRGLLDQNNEDDRILWYDLPIFDDRVLFASMAQGGALGIYGDFLFSDNDRFGGGFLQTLSGPSIGKLEDIYKIWRAWKTAGDDTDPEKAERERGALANQMARMLKGSIPGSNLWYSRQILDRYIWWNVQEAINPAALDRLEKSAAKRGDDYVFTRPTDARN